MTTNPRLSIKSLSENPLTQPSLLGGEEGFSSLSLGGEGKGEGDINSFRIGSKPALSTLAHSERREKLPDRRRQPTPVLSRYTFRGRRCRNRRVHDAQRNYYVDRFNPKILGWASSILIFSSLDGLFTLYHVNQGAIEANPFLNFCLSQSREHFLAIKTLMTAAGLFILIIHQNFFKMRSVLICLALIYIILLAYQLTLLFL